MVTTLWTRMRRAAVTAFAICNFSHTTPCVGAVALKERWTLSAVQSRSKAASLVDDILYPASERGRRISLGSPGLHESTLMEKSDPRLDETYGEFPLSSLDVLIDHAEQLAGRKLTRFLDLGSGCGRLVLYLALSRPDCHVEGIEISEIFHRESLSAVETAINIGLIENENTNSGQGSSNKTSVTFRLGPASSFPHVLHSAELIFCYSTAFPGAEFCPDSSALLLAPEWSELLSTSCQDGCICITTDKALDCSLGWKLLGRFEVPNPEVVSSTGFIQVLHRPVAAPGFV